MATGRHFTVRLEAESGARFDIWGAREGTVSGQRFSPSRSGRLTRVFFESGARARRSARPRNAPLEDRLTVLSARLDDRRAIRVHQGREAAART